MFGNERRKGFVLEAMDGYNERPAYCGWRTRHRMFVRWDGGKRGPFDYRLDPNECRNLAEKPKWASVRRSMRDRAFEACTSRLPRFTW